MSGRLISLKHGHMYTCPTSTIKLDSVGQTEFPIAVYKSDGAVQRLVQKDGLIETSILMVPIQCRNLDAHRGCSSVC